MMKREAGAAIVLALLILLSGWSIRKAESLCTEVGIALSKSRSAAEKLDYKKAREYFEQGLTLWQEAGSYSHVFLRHSEVDAANDAFYELKEKLTQEEPGAWAAAYDKLRYHLETISAMEKPSLGSVF